MKEIEQIREALGLAMGKFEVYEDAAAEEMGQALSALERMEQAASPADGEAERLQEKADKYMWQVHDTCRRAEALEKQLSGMDKLLDEAIEEMKDMVGYIPEYFDEKWGFNEKIEKIKKERGQ